MSRSNPIRDKSYKFALSIVAQARKIKISGQIDLSRQLLRSGTAIGANVEEALGAFTRKEFIYKLSIAYREARESEYWIRLLRDTGMLQNENATDLLHECRQLLRLLTSIIKSSKANLNNKSN